MKKAAVLALGTAILAYAFVHLASSAFQKGGHDFTEEQCRECHSYAPVKGDSRARMMNRPISVLCEGCHKRRKDDTLSHPVEMRPMDVTPPADLPLSWDGKVTCSTCHDIHAASSISTPAKEHYLRRAGGRAFCESCHNAGVATAAERSRHSQSLSVAHMDGLEETAGRADNISLICLSCHDGSTGPNANVQIGKFGHGAGGDSAATELSHPVGVNYRKAMLRRGGLHPPEQLDRKIRLVKGRVSCVSCHDIYYSRQQMLLAVPARGASLCLECHDK